MSLPMSRASQIFQLEEGIPLQHIVLEHIDTVMIMSGTPPFGKKKVSTLSFDEFLWLNFVCFFGPRFVVQVDH